MQPHLSYLVCATPRSGSTLFCEVLSTTGLAGQPKEYFEELKETGLPRQPQEYFETLEHLDALALVGGHTHRKDSARLAQLQGPGYADHLAAALQAGTTPNGVFGAKMMWGYFDDFLSHLWQIPAYKDAKVYDLLATVFPGLHYVHITRRDKIRQAVSLWKAIQTQIWRKDHTHTASERPSDKQLVFNFDAIDHLVQQIVAHEVAWHQYFHDGGIRPLVVVYEDLVSALEDTISKTLQYLTIPIPIPLPVKEHRMQRQADALSEQWVQRYYDHKRSQGDEDKQIVTSFF